MARMQINIREGAKGRGGVRARWRVHRWEGAATQRRAAKYNVREINAGDAVTGEPVTGERGEATLREKEVARDREKE